MMQKTAPLTNGRKSQRLSAVKIVKRRMMRRVMATKKMTTKVKTMIRMMIVRSHNGHADSMMKCMSSNWTMLRTWARALLRTKWARWGRGKRKMWAMRMALIDWCTFVIVKSLLIRTHFIILMLVTFRKFFLSARVSTPILVLWVGS